MNADAVAAIRDPVIKSRLDQLGVAAIASTPAELRRVSQGGNGQMGTGHQGSRHHRLRLSRIERENKSIQGRTP